MRRAILLVVAAVLTAAAPKKPPAAATDWTRVVAATADGGYRMGNPAARVKLVEYGSVWCPHCRHFHETALPKLKADYIRGGRVSYELRNFIFNLPDLGATLLVHCGGAPSYFRFLDTVYARQNEWEGAFLKLGKADADRINAEPDDRRPLAVARAMGLDKIGASLGLTPARFEKCLLDKATTAKLTALNNNAVRQLGIESTPTFLIDGITIADAATWDELEPALRASLK